MGGRGLFFFASKARCFGKKYYIIKRSLNNVVLILMMDYIYYSKTVFTLKTNLGEFDADWAVV